MEMRGRESAASHRRAAPRLCHPTSASSSLLVNGEAKGPNQRNDHLGLGQWWLSCCCWKTRASQASLGMTGGSMAKLRTMACKLSFLFSHKQNKCGCSSPHPGCSSSAPEPQLKPWGDLQGPRGDPEPCWKGVVSPTVCVPTCAAAAMYRSWSRDVG